MATKNPTWMLVWSDKFGDRRYVKTSTYIKIYKIMKPIAESSEEKYDESKGQLIIKFRKKDGLFTIFTLNAIRCKVTEDGRMVPYHARY